MLLNELNNKTATKQVLRDSAKERELNKYSF